MALAVAVAWASVDEIHQTSVPSRTGSPVDVAIDATGAAAALAVIAAGWRRSLDATTTALLWAAAVGGTAALVLNRVADVDGRVLWVTTPAAAVALVLRRRRGPRDGDEVHRDVDQDHSRKTSPSG
jgi:hypothetical protein